MDQKKITCITCPQGCEILVEGERENIASMSGQACKRGEEYARNEFIRPVRILTSSVKVTNSEVPLVSVRTKQPIPKEFLLKAMEEIRRVEVPAPVKRGDIIIPNILGTGTNLVATGEAREREACRAL